MTLPMLCQWIWWLASRHAWQRYPEDDISSGVAERGPQTTDEAVGRSNEPGNAEGFKYEQSCQ